MLNIYRLNTKILLTMLCLSGFELYSRWVPLLVLALKSSVYKSYKVISITEL